MFKVKSVINNNNENLLKNLCLVFEFQQQSILQDKFWQKHKFVKVQISTLCSNDRSNIQNQIIER